MTQGKLGRGYYYERNVDVRLKKQDKKYKSKYVFLFVLLALSIYFIIQAVFDNSPESEIVNIKKDTVKNTVDYFDDSENEQMKFAGMQARFLVFSQDNKTNRDLVLVKSRKAEKKYGKILDKAQTIHGEKDRSFRKIVKAIIIAESDSNDKAVSNKGAKGAMGIMPVNFHFLGIKNPFDPAENILGGAKMIRHLLDKYDGDKTSALICYNAGPKGLERDYLLDETKNYLVRIEYILKNMNL